MERTLAAGRTLRRRVESQIVPVGQVVSSGLFFHSSRANGRLRAYSYSLLCPTQTNEKYNFQPAANKRIVNFKNQVPRRPGRLPHHSVDPARVHFRHSQPVPDAEFQR